MKKKLVTALLVLTVGCAQAPAVPDCAEDENWDAVDYQDPRGQEDINGVTRACVHIDE